MPKIPRSSLLAGLLACMADPSSAATGSIAEHLAACSRFNGDSAKLQCYEAVTHSTSEHLWVLPPGPPKQPPAIPPSEQCNPVFDLARIIMETRQSGADMRQLLAAFNADQSAAALIRQAIDYPGYLLTEQREQAAMDFANRVYAGCLRAF